VALDAVQEPVHDAAGDHPPVDAHGLVGVYGLAAALAAGTVAQGGYYVSGRVLLTVLVAGAAVLAVRERPRVARLFAGPVPAACGLLALWVLIRATTTDSVDLALAAAATLGTVAAAAVVVRAAGPVAREQGAKALTGLGALVGFTAWLGVATRTQRFVVLVETKLWRGASTLTYPNAAAALLVPLALLALGLVAARGYSYAAAAYLALVGVGATLSRAGLIALAAGLVMLALIGGHGPAGPLRVLWRCAPIGLGAAVAVAALGPSFPHKATPHPGIAVAGLLIGAAVALGLPRLPGAVRAAALPALAAAGGVVAWSRRHAPYLHPLLASRGNLDSSERSQAAHYAVELLRRYPLTGMGVGQSAFIVTGPDGGDAVAQYAHDEYLQTAVDLGLVGAVLLLGLLGAAALAIIAGRRTPARPRWAGATAALTAFAVHSGLDFLWHLAALPLLAGVLIGLATTGPAATAPRGHREERTTAPHDAPPFVPFDAPPGEEHQ
jgi:hypothetical protein